MSDLLYSSVCLLVVTSAQNRGQLEEQLALGRSLQFKKGKLSMIIMSENQLNLVNVTKIPFPIMLLEADRNKPREELNNLECYISDIMNLTPNRFLCPVIGESAPLMMTESFCPKWTKSIQGKRLRFGVIGPKPYFFVQGSAKRWALGCVNPASWLPLAAGPSSRNLGPTF